MISNDKFRKIDAINIMYLNTLSEIIIGLKRNHKLFIYNRDLIKR